MRELIQSMIAALLVSVAFVGHGHADSLPGEGKTVRFAQNDSLGANYVQDWIIVKALEALGYKIDFKTISTTLFFQAAAQGDLDMTGDIDWSQRQSQYNKVADKVALLSEGTILGGGVNGYIIDKKTADAYKITNIEQLKDPKIAVLFNSTGDGKADLANCDPGWSCGDLVDHQIKAYGLSDTVQSVRAKYEALMAEAVARVKRGEPVIFYGWAPSFVASKLAPGKDIVWLPTPFDALPEGIDAGNTLVAGVVGCAGDQDPCRLTNQPWNWRLAANREFLAANPAVEKLAEVVGWPMATWSAWENDMSTNNSPRATQAIAEKWIEDNKVEFDKWVEHAKSGAK